MEEILKQILGELQNVNNRLDRLDKGQEKLQNGQDMLKDNLLDLDPFLNKLKNTSIPKLLT